MKFTFDMETIVNEMIDDGYHIGDLKTDDIHNRFFEYLMEKTDIIEKFESQFNKTHQEMENDYEKPLSYEAFKKEINK